MEDKKTTRLAYLSGMENRDTKFEFVAPHEDIIAEFFARQAEWLDSETDAFHDRFDYKGHGTWEHETVSYKEVIPVLKLGKVVVDRMLEEGQSLDKYYQYCWQFLELDKLIDQFVEDVGSGETLNVITTPDVAGVATWSALTLLYHIFDNSKDRVKCLRLAMRRAGMAIVTNSLILACADTIKAKRSA